MTFKIGVDATNLRRGGGITHLIELISAAEPINVGISSVVLWGGSQTLALIEDQPWLDKRSPAELDQGLFQRTWWQLWQLSQEAKTAECDLLFVPGGSYAGTFHPVVTMSRNLLPFELEELFRYGFSATTLKLLLLRWSQSRSFRLSDGVIFLSQAARESVFRVTGKLKAESPIIPHGLNSRFCLKPKIQSPISSYSIERPYRLIYVSTVDQYKHQWHIVEVVSALRREGFPITLDLVGPGYPRALQRLNATISRCDPKKEWVCYHGAVVYSELHNLYAKADLGIFASSCENMPNILLETMAAGLPVACSDRGPMREVLGNTGVYFEPDQPEDIFRAVRGLIESPILRTERAEASFAAALKFDWEHCAFETFSFLAKIADKHRKQAE